MAAEGEVGDEETGHESRDVASLPDVTEDDDDPGCDHAGAGGEFAGACAKGKQGNAATVFDGDGPQHAQIARIEDAWVDPAADVAKGVHEVDHVAHEIHELQPQSVTIHGLMHSIVHL